MKDITEGLGERIEASSIKISSSFDKMKHEVYMVERTEGLYAELLKVEGLTLDEVVRSTLVIGRDNALLIQFPTIPDVVKSRWIKAVIQ